MEKRTEKQSKETLLAHESLQLVPPDISTQATCSSCVPMSFHPEVHTAESGRGPILLPTPPPDLEASQMPGKESCLLNFYLEPWTTGGGPASSVLPGAHGPLTLTFLISSLLCGQRLCEYRRRRAGSGLSLTRTLVASLVFLPARVSPYVIVSWICIPPNGRCERWGGGVSNLSAMTDLCIHRHPTSRVPETPVVRTTYGPNTAHVRPLGKLPVLSGPIFPCP